MATDEVRDGLHGEESRKTTKSTTEYRKTEQETHEVTRSGGGADAIMVLRGTRSALWFDLKGGVYVARYARKFTLTHDAAGGAFKLAAPNGEITVNNAGYFDDYNN